MSEIEDILKQRGKAMALKMVKTGQVRSNDALAQKMTEDKTVANVYQLLKADLSLSDVDDQ